VRADIVIKRRGRPTLGVVAIRAMSLAVLRQELAVVFVVMARLALRRSTLEP